MERRLAHNFEPWMKKATGRRLAHNFAEVERVVDKEGRLGVGEEHRLGVGKPVAGQEAGRRNSRRLRHRP